MGAKIPSEFHQELKETRAMRDKGAELIAVANKQEQLILGNVAYKLQLPFKNHLIMDHNKMEIIDVQDEG